MARRDEVVFKSGDGMELRGWHYHPVSRGGPPSAGSPVVVMTHGYGAVKEMYLDTIAEHFSDSGLACLVYDHRGLGASGGVVRQELDPQLQISDLRDAITFARTLPGVDRDKVGLWGSSFSGGHALVVAATDRRVGAVVAQVPTISGQRNTKRRYAGDAVFELHRRLAADRDARMRGEPPQVLPIVDGWEPSGSKSDSAPVPVGNDQLAWMASIGSARTRTWRNELTLRSTEMYSAYEPGAHVADISPTPLLMICMAQDTVVNADEVLEAYNRAHEPKKLVLMQGGHFDVYGVHRRELAELACDHYLEHLPAN